MKNIALTAIAALTFALTTAGIARSETARGSWSITTSASTTRLATNWSDATGTHKNSDVRAVDARSLDIASALASGGAHVQFSITREAGSYAFEGWVANGSGGGTFSYTPNSAFFDDLRKRGLTIASDDPIGSEMAATDMDITRAYVDDILHTGLTLDFRQLITFRALDIDAAYVRELASVGFAHLEARQYITFKALKIDSAYVKYLRAHGLQNLTAREVITAKAEQI